MAATKYSFSISQDFPNHKVATDRLTVEIQLSAIIIALDHINTAGDVCDIWTKDELSDGDQAVLAAVVHSHSGDPLPQNVPQDVNIKTSSIVLPYQEKGFQDLTGHNFYKKGLLYTAIAGQVTDMYLKFNTTMYLNGGGYKIGTGAVDGDYLQMQLVDKDNILGYGAGFVLATFVDTDYCWSGKEWEIITSDAKAFPAGIYLRMRYTSAGQSDVKVVGWYCLRT